jgi:hypothetical protein
MSSSRFCAAAAALVAALACTSGSRPATPAAGNDTAPVTVVAADTGWRALFDGRTTAGWRGYRRPDMPAGWEAIDGALTRTGPGGDIITADQFGNFELELEWMVAPGGNSGIFYRVTEVGEAGYHTGPEMQVLDDAAHADGLSRLTAAGSAYGLYPAAPGVAKPAGEWNAVRIVARGPHVEHWLNGTKVLEYELASEPLKAAIAKSKFKDIERFGKPQKGHILLQDHGDAVCYRNVKIRSRNGTS